MGRGSLRIVGGELGGRRFSAPVSTHTRATGERVREAIASALEARDAVHGASVLDLFAGTGALAFEALSRGADRAVLVERDRKTVRAIVRSARQLGLSERTTVLALDLQRRPPEVASRLQQSGAEGPFSLVFADPPYAAVDAVPPLVDALAHRGLLAPEALVILEHATRQPPAALGRLAPLSRYGYGDTTVVLATVSTGA